MTNSSEIRELSVADLFRTDEYIIPIYQRNFAWGETEIEQLLEDVRDAATLTTTPGGGPLQEYYIGCLVTDYRGDGVFAIVDGQQRHTTLGIILAVLKNVFSEDIDGIQQLNLSFDSRPKSAATLHDLFLGIAPDEGAAYEPAIRAGYEIARRFLAREGAGLIPKIAEYLLRRVKLLRVILPGNTDLNHYFEIMNNRGEQLEKHEVLKARLMSRLGNESHSAGFAAIWDACAEMGRYVQFNFDSQVRTAIFGNDWNGIPTDFDAICKEASRPKGEVSARSVASIISAPQLRARGGKPSPEEDVGNFGSVINFPNFLLHVLRVTSKKDIPLDDKRLLESFIAEKPDPRVFILDLLRCRLLFDRYVIKRENDEDWSLKSVKVYYRVKRTSGYVNTAESDEKNQQLIMLLSMFHVSFPALVYKHWLTVALKHLYVTSQQGDVSIDKYLDRMEKFSDRVLYGRFGCYEAGEPIDYYRLTFKKVEKALSNRVDASFLNQGTCVQNFIFNRLDYLLWKRLRDKQKFPGVNMGYVCARAREFRFAFRTSVEHYYPQHPRVGQVLKKSSLLPGGCDSFGNLCLISHSSNSRLSDYLPAAKKEHYEKSAAVESLKQAFMMSYPNWGPNHCRTIAEHERMMVKVLCG